MPSRITFRHLGIAQQSIQEFTNNLEKSDRGSAQIHLADVCLQISKAEINGGFHGGDLSLQSQIHRVLKEAAAARSSPKPLWAGYAEATLHFVERTLGMHAAHANPDRLIHVEPERARGQRCGTYSTPDFIADTMASEVLSLLGENQTCAADILDLSLEAGQFPLSFLSNGCRSDLNFYGIDRDPVALQIARRIVRFATTVSRADHFRLKLASRDSLLQDLPGTWPSQFSAIIGNPPWKARHAVYTAKVREHFQPALRSNFDLYLAFILRANQLLNSNGILSFVIPSTFLFNDNAKEIRHLLLENYDILSLRLYPQRSFIEVPCLIPISFLARKRPQESSLATTLISYHGTKLGGPKRPRHTKRVKIAKVWSELPGHVFHPLVRPQSTFLYSSSSSATLQEMGKIVCGARLSSRIARRSEYPFIGVHARDIRAFHACTRSARKYETHDAVFDRPPELAAIDAPKIVFQDLRYMTHATRLVAAVAPRGTLAVSTASMCIPTEPHFVNFYAALLNSSFANAWYKVRDVSRSIKLFHIRELPIVVNFQGWARIELMARECAHIRARIHAMRRTGLLEEERFLRSRPSEYSALIRLLDQIDDEVFDLYKLTKAQRSIARKFVGARTF